VNPVRWLIELEQLPGTLLDDAAINAILTDPVYGLGGIVKITRIWELQDYSITSLERLN
jgi:hypothetical protein